MGRLGAFMHCNTRHHSFAFFANPEPRKKIHHIMMEYTSIDDVGTAYDLCLERDFVTATLGRHLNDHMLSFYFKNPGTGISSSGGVRGRSTRRRGRSSTTAACSPAAANGATRAVRRTGIVMSPHPARPGDRHPTKGDDMLSAAEVTGLLALPPSPLKADGEHLTDADTLDLDEATRLAGQMIGDGAAAIGLCGTTGECATLLWDKKLALLRRRHQHGRPGRCRVVAGRRRSGRARWSGGVRAARRSGAAAAFVGLPLWQTPTMESADGVASPT